MALDASGGARLRAQTGHTIQLDNVGGRTLYAWLFAFKPAAYLPVTGPLSRRPP